MGKKEYTITVVDPKYKAFIVYIATLNISSAIGDKVHLSIKAQIAHLKVDKASPEVFNKYANFTDLFLPKLVTKLLKHKGINDYAIKLVDNQQLPYGLIYSLSLVELEILKTYIKNNLANRFIRLPKFSIRAPIFFERKPDKSLRLYVDY